MKLYIANLKWSINDEELKHLFLVYGKVISANVILDRETGRSRGFGFVEMENEDDAKKAIEGLEGKEIQGRVIVIRQAVPEGEKADKKSEDDPIGDFAKIAEIDEEYSFKFGEKRFIIRRES